MLKPETIKLLEENRGSQLLDIDLGDDFVVVIPKSKTRKVKINKLGLYQTEIFLYCKEIHKQNEKATY